MTKGDVIQSILLIQNEDSLFDSACEVNDTFTIIQNKEGYYHHYKGRSNKAKYEIIESRVVDTRKEAIVSFFLTAD